MSVSLRLSRGGSKKRPFFRIVAADVRSPRDGRYLERLGTYNPMLSKDDPNRISINKERIKYWLSVGAKPTDRVTKFLAKEGLAETPSIPKQTKQDKPKKKTLEKLKTKEEKLKAKKEMEDAASDQKVDNSKGVEEEKSVTEETTEQKTAATQDSEQEKPKTEETPEQKTTAAQDSEQEKPKTEETSEQKTTAAQDSEKEKPKTEEASEQKTSSESKKD